MNKNGAHKSYYLQWFLLNSLSLLPLRVLYVLADIIYVLLFYVTGYRRKVVKQNLKNAFPDKPEDELAKIEKQFYHNLSDIIVETLKLAYISKADLERRTKFVDQDVLQQLYDKKTPFIALCSHMGNWEWGIAGSSANFPIPVDGIYKPLNNGFFETYMQRLRSRFGARLIPMKDTLRDFLRMKNVPRVVAMLSDQTPPGGEIQYWTKFFNQDTGFYVGVDKLVSTFNYPVIFVKMTRIKRGFYEISTTVIYDGLGSIPKGSFKITEKYKNRLEKAIQEDPANYLWSHKRWKHKKPENINSEIS